MGFSRRREVENVNLSSGRKLCLFNTARHRKFGGFREPAPSEPANFTTKAVDDLLNEIGADVGARSKGGGIVMQIGFEIRRVE